MCTVTKNISKCHFCPKERNLDLGETVQCEKAKSEKKCNGVTVNGIYHEWICEACSMPKAAEKKYQGDLDRSRAVLGSK
jgi:hypothetical protein